MTTQNGRVLQLSDGVVVKEFVDRDKAKRDWRALCMLFELFPGACVAGWTYKVPKPLSWDRQAGSITMTKAEGVPLSDAMKNDPALAWHAGVWIALFHQAVADADGRVLILPDFTRDHVYVHEPSRTVTTIDPGASLGKRRMLPGRDLLEFCRSSFIGLAPRFWTGRSVIRAFFAGYAQVAEGSKAYEGIKLAAPVTGAGPKSRFRSSGVLRFVDRVFMAVLYRYARRSLARGVALRS